MPYFMVNNFRQFMGFTEATFEAKLVSCQTREDSNDVIHAEIEILGSRIFVADSGFCGGSWISPTSGEGANCRSTDGGKPIQMFVQVDDADEAYRKALAAGAESAMAPYDDNDSRMGGFVDPFGNLWWLRSFK